MSPEPRFFPFDPRGLRLGLLSCAALGVLLAAWTFATARDSGDALGFARTSLLIALTIAFGWVGWRVRPRSGWGVRIDASGLTVSRPLWGESLHLRWSQLSGVRRDGPRGERLLLRLHPEGRVLLPRRWFGSREIFDALSQALESRLLRRGLDT